MLRNAEAEWKGSLKEGGGKMKLGSGAYEGAFTFKSRFENGAGTNPEELIAAAHAGCFSMALSSSLEKAGLKPERVHTVAKVHFDRDDKGPLIKQIELITEVSAAGLDQAKLEEIGAQAKAGCPVSRALAAVPSITLAIKLV
ncbi:MAG TPA: OsmC family protein [Myxococcales bacterium]|jgi:osmotically inducible protein OsmC|nr:OsmC family protein [Myxococcales bacterium]